MSNLKSLPRTRAQTSLRSQAVRARVCFSFPVTRSMVATACTGIKTHQTVTALDHNRITLIHMKSIRTRSAHATSMSSMIHKAWCVAMISYMMNCTHNRHWSWLMLVILLMWASTTYLTWNESIRWCDYMNVSFHDRTVIGTWVSDTRHGTMHCITGSYLK